MTTQQTENRPRRDDMDLVTDYVLGLLTAEETRAFEARTAVDEHLRQAVLAERMLYTAVQETLTTASAPPERILRQRPRPRAQRVSTRLRPLVLTAVLAFLMLGSIGLGAQPLTPNTAVAATVSVAHAQTAVPTQTQPVTKTRPAASAPLSPPTLSPSPQPQKTPAAQFAPRPATETNTEG